MLRNGQQFAAGPGLTTVTPTLDFETYSEAGYQYDRELEKWVSLPGLSPQKRGLEAVGARAYIEHPSFEILCLAYDLFDGQGLRRWKPEFSLEHDYFLQPSDLVAHTVNGGLLAGWNGGGFEFSVWNYYCVPKLGWPSLRIEQMRCDMAKARAYSLPGKLEKTAEVLDLVHKKNPDGKRLLRKFSIPRNPTVKDARLRLYPDEDPIDGPKLTAYNDEDVLTEVEAGLRIPDLTPFEQQVWFTDQRINHRGVQADLKAARDCLSIFRQFTLKLNWELRELTNGQVIAATELPELSKWCQGQGFYFPSMDEESIEAILKRTDLTPAVRRAIQIRSALASSSVKKLFSILYKAAASGRLHELYAYHAARTGRWNGQDPQPMNLPKGDFKSIYEVEACLAAMATQSLTYVESLYPDVLGALASCLRGLFIAGPGCELMCSDYSAIEGVVTAALAGEEWRLEVFRTHGMNYETSAALITGIPFADFVEHKKRTGQHHPQRALIGKFAELASGFQGWIGAWKNFGADEHLTDDEIKRAILTWRDASPMIVELWGGQTRNPWSYNAYPERFGLEGAAISAVERPGQAYQYRGIVYQVEHDALFCQLPSGRLMTYHRPRLEPSDRREGELSLSYEGWNSNAMSGPVGWLRMRTYGGKLTENAVQAVARDIQAHALVNLEARGYPIVLHTHDEAVAEVPTGWGSIAEFESIMEDVPAFARGWPIRARGGWRGHRYRKD